MNIKIEKKSNKNNIKYIIKDNHKNKIEIKIGSVYMKENYDVIVVGMGPGAIFMAYEMTKLEP